MQRTFTKPADSKESRPKTAGEVIIDNLKKDGDVIGIVVDGEKWSVEKLCRHEVCKYCENCPMHLAIELQRVNAYYGQCELMVFLESLECPLAVVMLDDFLDPKQNTPEELACHEFAYGFVCFGLGVKDGLDWIEKAEKDGSKEAKQFLKHLNKMLTTILTRLFGNDLGRKTDEMKPGLQGVENSYNMARALCLIR